jgi:hypothetical protein
MNQKIVQGTQQLSNEEMELLSIFRKLDAENRARITRFAGAFWDGQNWISDFMKETGESYDVAIKASLAHLGRELEKQNRQNRLNV